MSLKMAKDQGDMPYQELLDKNHALEAEVQDLKIRLQEAEELGRAINEGDLDALIIPGPQGKLVFTLESADHAYRVLVETMNEGTATIACDGTILYCNRRFAELIRMPTQAIVGKSIYEFIESEDTHTFNALLMQKTNAGEIQLKAKSDMPVPVYLSISPLHTEGSQNAWCLVVTDLTEQKKNEEIVSAGRLARSIIEQAAEAIVVCDTEGKITHFSNAVSGICECDPSYRKFEDIMDLQFSEGEDAEKSILPVSSALRGEMIIGTEAILEVKDCQGFHQKLHLLLNSGPLKNSDGKIIGCVVTLTDITYRKRAEETLRQALEKAEEGDRLLAVLMEYVPMGITIADASGQIHTVSRYGEELLGGAHSEKSIDEVVAQWMVYQPDGITPMDIDELPLTRAIQKAEIVKDLELVQVNTYGKKLSLLCNSAPIPDSRGNITGGIVAWHDITERKLAEKALHESEKRFRLLSEANSILLLSKEPENMIQNIAEKVMNHLNCDVFFNYVFDESKGKLHLNAYGGISAETAKEIEWLDEGAGICGCVARDGYRIVSRDVQHNEDKRSDLVRAMGIQAYACQPLHVRDKTIGTLSFGTKSRKNFKEDELALMSTVADQVSVAFERKRAEEALRESEEISRQRLEEIENLYRNAPVGLCELDHELRYVRLNKRLAEINGMSVENHIGKRVRDVLPQSVADIVEPQMLRVLETGKPLIDIEIVGETISQPGIERSWMEKWLPMIDAQGSVTGLNIVVEETTERKKMEKELQESEEKYRNIIETANEGIWILDPEARIVYANQKIAEMLGYNHEEIIGRAAWDFTDHEGKEVARKNMEKGKQGIDIDHELKLIRKNGTPLWTIVSAKALFDKDGKFMGSMKMLTNITERKEAEVKLKQTLDNLENLVKERTAELEKAYSSLEESEERYRSFIENFQGIAFQADENFIPVFMHGTVEEITGYREEEFMSRQPWKEIIHPEDLTSIYEEEEKVRNSQHKDYGEIDFRIICRDGKIKWMHEIYQKIPGHDGTPESYQGAIYDITERKEAEEALAKMDRVRIKEIHHRIKNNLQVICSLLSLEAERFCDEKILEALKESQNRVTSMALIHEELYKGDKSDALDFSAYLRKLAAELFSSYSIGNDNISLKMDLEQAYLDIDTAIPLGIIVNELVSNSLKHAFPAESEGEVHISLHRTETPVPKDDTSRDQTCSERGNFQYVLRVADNGKGIPEEIEFENVESLGLQLVNILVEQIDGCTELKREGGTEFAIYFDNKEQ